EGDAGEDGEVLVVVGADVAGAVVERDAVEAEVDAEAAVVVNGIAADRVARAGPIEDHDPGTAIEGDRVAGPRRDVADRVTRRGAYNHHAVLLVGRRLLTVDVRADEVALDHIARVGCAPHLHAIAVVARDDVSGPGRRAADRDVRDVRPHAEVLEVVQAGGAAGVQADDVALDEVAAASAAGEADAATAGGPPAVAR